MCTANAEEAATATTAGAEHCGVERGAPDLNTTKRTARMVALACALSRARVCRSRHSERCSDTGPAPQSILCAVSAGYLVAFGRSSAYYTLRPKDPLAAGPASNSKA